jgi:hypothetical protein
MPAKTKKSQKNGASASNRAYSYRHVEAESPMRPDIGTQAQFKKRKPPQKYRYDSSISPALDWDGKNSAREHGEALNRAERDTTKSDLLMELSNRCLSLTISPKAQGSVPQII